MRLVKEIASILTGQYAVIKTERGLDIEVSLDSNFHFTYEEHRPRHIIDGGFPMPLPHEYSSDLTATVGSLLSNTLMICQAMNRAFYMEFCFRDLSIQLSDAYVQSRLYDGGQTVLYKIIYLRMSFHDNTSEVDT
jgi:hypothetical protein